jgi:hypothetical protein
MLVIVRRTGKGLLTKGATGPFTAVIAVGIASTKTASHRHAQRPAPSAQGPDPLTQCEHDVALIVPTICVSFASMLADLALFTMRPGRLVAARTGGREERATIVAVV